MQRDLNAGDAWTGSHEAVSFPDGSQWKKTKKPTYIYRQYPQGKLALHSSEISVFNLLMPTGV